MDALGIAIDRGLGCLFKSDIFKACFVDPFEQNLGYNIPMTIVYGAILIILAFFVIYPILNKRGIKFDDKFNRALIPFILLGSSIRLIPLVNDLAPTFNPLTPGFYFQTPGIWFLVTALTIASLLLSLHFGKNNFADYFGAIGVVLLLANVAIIGQKFTHWGNFYLVILIIAAITALIYFAYNWKMKQPWSKIFHAYFQPKLLQNQSNVLAMAGQVIDGTATAIAITFFGFSEQHVVSDLLLSLSPWLFPLVKIILILVILSYAETEIKDSNMRGFLRMFLIVLGWATGGASVFKLGL